MQKLERLLSYNLKAELARRSFGDFVLYQHAGYSMQFFHEYICQRLTAFANGQIKKLMVFMPPQHGKSQLTTRLFPSYLLGKRPDCKMVVASYNATLASRFNRDIQRVIDSQRYNDVFPDTYLNESNVVTVSDNYLRNSEIFEIVGHNGFLKTVGRGGALTGTPIDVGIIDDPIKDRAEAMSSTIRESLWSWYEDVFETRLHNESQQILIQTRWHEEDLAGRLLERDDDWEVIVFEAIKQTEHPYDTREMGQALWPEKHSFERIQKVRETSPITFNSLYQQSPKPTEDQGILWTRQLVKRSRLNTAPDLTRIVVAIDPATTANKNSDETGIIVCAKDAQGNGYVLEDSSGIYTPKGWAQESHRLLQKWGADCYVAEKNQGGDMVEAVLRQSDPSNRIKLVTATKGKFTRAEPVFNLYEQNRIFHVGVFTKLESQMITFNPESSAKSPDRVDALVWGFTDLMLSSKQKLFIARR